MHCGRVFYLPVSACCAKRRDGVVTMMSVTWTPVEVVALEFNIRTLK